MAQKDSLAFSKEKSNSGNNIINDAHTQPPSAVTACDHLPPRPCRSSPPVTTYRSGHVGPRSRRSSTAAISSMIRPAAVDDRRRRGATGSRRWMIVGGDHRRIRDDRWRQSTDGVDDRLRRGPTGSRRWMIIGGGGKTDGTVAMDDRQRRSSRGRGSG